MRDYLPIGSLFVVSGNHFAWLCENGEDINLYHIKLWILNKNYFKSNKGDIGVILSEPIKTRSAVLDIRYEYQRVLINEKVGWLSVSYIHPIEEPQIK